MNRFCKIWWGTAKMGPLGFLPSGSAMLVYDGEGKLIDWTGDEGENGRFQRKWSKVGLTNACERTGCKFDVYDGTVEIHE